METKVLDHISGLPNWMQFTILIILVLTTVVSFIFKIRSDNKVVKEQMNVSAKLISNEHKFGTLLDLLYSRFANNLSIDVAKEIIPLCYLRTKYVIKDKVIALLKTHNYTPNGLFDKAQFKYDIIEFINNRYYEDSMFLGKLTCKSIKLNFYHNDKVKPEQIIDSISIFLETSNFKLNCSMNNFQCLEFGNYLDTMFTTIINKTLIQLEDIVSKINSDYGE